MDMLYENKLYDETLKVFQIVTENETNNIKYPNDCTTVAFATYYALVSIVFFYIVIFCPLLGNIALSH